MSSMTNAQAALQAAATIYSGTAGNVSTNTVQGMAHHLKRGLDRMDQVDKDAKDAARQATPTPPRVVGFAPHPDDTLFPKPGPRVPVFTDEHRLSEDHNTDPVCACSWNPALEYPSVGTREEARRLIWSHIAVERHGPKPNVE